MILTILGAPGAGKGTVAAQLSKFMKIPTISTGALLRDKIASGSDIGLKIDSLISKGNFVPDEMMVEILVSRLEEDDCKNGYILDGFPRNKKQAEHLVDYGINLTKAILLNVRDDEIISRLTNRRECSECRATYHLIAKPPKKEGICDVCGGMLKKRDDDNSEIIRKRLSIYHKETEPLITFFKELNLLVTVDGADKVEDTKNAVFAALGVKN